MKTIEETFRTVVEEIEYPSVLYTNFKELGRIFVVCKSQDIDQRVRNLFDIRQRYNLKILSAQEYSRQIIGQTESQKWLDMMILRIDNSTKLRQMSNFFSNYFILHIENQIWNDITNPMCASNRFDNRSLKKTINELSKRLENSRSAIDIELTAEFAHHQLGWLSAQFPEIAFFAFSPISLSNTIDCLHFILLDRIESLPSSIEDELREYFLYASRTILDLFAETRYQLYFKNALSSALSAIMSRNMSHNLGSHVLARISTGSLNGWTKNLSTEDIANVVTLRAGYEFAQEKGILEHVKKSDSLGQLYEKIEKRPNVFNAETAKPIIKDLLLSQEQAKEFATDYIYWSKDVQILSRYIQQRMDFIAQISTDWPEWTEPVYLLKNLMRWFLSQKHLLNYIADSEGLGAHVFNGRQVPKQPDIRLHVFLIPNGKSVWHEPVKAEHMAASQNACVVQARVRQISKDCFGTEKNGMKLGCRHLHSAGEKSFLQVSGASTAEDDVPSQPCEDCHRILFYTPEKKEPLCCLDEDIQLAIPGGIVGYHAFYVILENVIRNAAKHGYTKAKKQVTHLDVVIEILHDPEDRIGIQGKDEQKVPAWLFRIYANVSYLKNGEKSGVRLWGKNSMNSYLGTSIITESGELRKENWGLAEMKIAAGYLQRREITEIGAEGADITGQQKGLARGKLDTTMLDAAAGESGSPHIIRAVPSPVGTLAYEFYVPKPRSVGIVCMGNPKS